jgi:hypothetical protein
MKRTLKVKLILLIIALSLIGLLLYGIHRHRSTDNTNNTLGVSTFDSIKGNIQSAEEVKSEASEVDLNPQIVVDTQVNESQVTNNVTSSILQNENRDQPRLEIQREETTEQVCTSKLIAIIERPYTFNYHMGDKAEMITASHISECVDTSNIRYEWKIWRSGSEAVVFSTSADPDFSNFETNTYDVLLTVYAGSLSASTKTWVYVNNSNQAPIVTMSSPYTQQIYTANLDEGGRYVAGLNFSGYAYDPEQGNSLTVMNTDWFIEESDGVLHFLGVGVGASKNFVVKNCLLNNYKVIFKATDSDGATTTLTREILIFCSE